MSYINQKQTPRKDTHLNWMGGPAYNVSNPLTKLKLASASCFFGEPMYYHRDAKDARPLRVSQPGRLSNTDVEYLRETLDAIDPQEWRTKSPAELMESAIDEALAFDAESTLGWAAILRQEENMRVTPQVILVRAANTPALKGTGLVRKYAPEIIRRADEPATGMAYQLAVYGKPIPNSLKKAWKDALEKYDDYALAKYRMENRVVKTVDVVNMVHAKSESVDKLVNDNLRTTDKTWESIISEKGSTKEAWLEAVDVMGHMALLRNVRNLIKAGVMSKYYLDKLLQGVPNGKQLPFRYYSAYKAVEDVATPEILDVLEECLVVSLDNLPTFQGRVMSLVDNSGSAWHTTTSSMGTMPIATIGNLTGVLTGMQSQEGYVGVFGDRLEVLPARKRSSIFDTLKQVNRLGDHVGHSTENGIWLFWDKAIKQKEQWDTVFVYSDMQAGHGGLYGIDSASYSDYTWVKGRIDRYIDVPKLINTYRSQVNPNVNVFLVQTAGYQDTIIPEYYNKTYMLGGWSDSVLKFAHSMISMVQ